MQSTLPARPPSAVLTWLWLAAGLLLVLLATLAEGLLDSTLPILAERVHAEGSAINWIVSGHLVTLAALVVPAALIGELLGHARVQFVGVVWFLAGWVITALATSGGAVILGQLVAGAGLALLLPAAVGYARRELPGWPRGLVYAGFAVAWASGGYLGAYLGGLFIGTLSDRTLYLLLLPFGLLGLALTVPVLLRPVRPRIDWLALPVALLALLGGGLLAATSVAADFVHLSPLAILGFVAGGLLLVGAAVLEGVRCGLRAGLGASLALFLLLTGTEHVSAMVLYLQVVAGSAPRTVYALGFAVLLGAVLGAGLAVPAMSFVDGRLIAGAGLLLTAGAAAADLVLVSSSVRTLLLYGATDVLSGLGTGLALTALIAARTRPSTVERQPAAGPVLVFGLLALGDVGGVLVLDFIIKLAGSSDEPFPKLWQHLVVVAEAVCLGLLLLGAVVALVLGPAGRPTRDPARDPVSGTA